MEEASRASYVCGVDLVYAGLRVLNSEWDAAFGAVRVAVLITTGRVIQLLCGRI